MKSTRFPVLATLNILVFLLVFSGVTGTRSDRYCECWEKHYGNPISHSEDRLSLQSCLNQVFNPNDKPSYTEEDKQRCWYLSKHAQYKDTSEFCLLLRIQEVLPLFLEGFIQLQGQMTNLELGDVQRLMFEGALLSKSNEYFCQHANEFRVYFEPINYYPNILRAIALSLNLKLDGLLRWEYEIEKTEPTATDTTNCIQALNTREKMFSMWKKFMPLLEYTIKYCKDSAYQYLCETNVLVRDLVKFYYKYKDDNMLNKHMCEPMRLRLILNSIGITHASFERGDGSRFYKVRYYTRYSKETIMAGLDKAISSIYQHIEQQGAKGKRLQFFVEAVPDDAPDRWVKNLTRWCYNRIKNGINHHNYEPHLKTWKICTVSKMVQSMNDLFKSTTKKVIDTSIHYRSYLRMEALKQAMDEKFAQLSTYFTKVNEFNELKARNDLAFIDRRLDKFRDNLKTVSDKISKDLSYILHAALVTAGTELAMRTIDFVADSIAAASPFTWIIGTTRPSTVATTLREMLKAGQQVVAVEHLRLALENVEQSSKEMKEKFAGKKEALKRMYDLIHFDDADKELSLEVDGRNFLAEYGEFDPAIDPGEIEKIESKWLDIVEKGCSILSSASGNPSSVVYQHKTKGMCIGTRGNIAEMISLFQAIYAFQGEYKVACAEYIRQRLAVGNAKELNTAIGIRQNLESNKEVSRKQLEEIATINYRVEYRKMVETYCDTLEYKNGGVRHTACKQGKIHLEDVLKSKAAKRKAHHYIIDIPEMNYLYKIKDAVNVTEISMNKEVTFKIPNFDWLVKNGPFLKKDANIPLYVRRFALFIPITKDDTFVQSEGHVIGANQLVEGGIDYSSVIPYKSTYEYRVGGKCTRPPRRDNPYDYCKDPLPKYCAVTEDYLGCDDSASRAPYPSIFARWQFQVTLKNRENIIIPASKITVKGLLVVCRSEEARTHKRQNTITRESISNVDCCTGNQFMDITTKVCEDCPTGSHPELKGYFCQRDEE